MTDPQATPPVMLEKVALAMGKAVKDAMKISTTVPTPVAGAKPLEKQLPKLAERNSNDVMSPTDVVEALHSVKEVASPMRTTGSAMRTVYEGSVENVMQDEALKKALSQLRA